MNNNNEKDIVLIQIWSVQNAYTHKNFETLRRHYFRLDIFSSVFKSQNLQSIFES